MIQPRLSRSGGLWNEFNLIVGIPTGLPPRLFGFVRNATHGFPWFVEKHRHNNRVSFKMKKE
jgi:hypothetical protein